MRPLANENIPGVAVSALAADGHDVVWVRTVAPGAPDVEVLAWAARESRILLTFDKDFGELAQNEIPPFRKFRSFRILRLWAPMPIMGCVGTGEKQVMGMAALTSVPPSKKDIELARASGQRLASVARRGRPLTLRVRAAGEEATIELPAGAVKLLQAILEDMASGRAVTIVPQNAELTTQQAADFLNVSRPFLVGLLEQKKLPFRLVGTHRRVRFEDVLRFKENTDAERRKVLDQLAAEAQELKMGY
jgi:excisionase family DNA binding protein